MLGKTFVISLAGSYDSETFSVKREGGHKRTKQNPLTEREKLPHMKTTKPNR